MMKYKGYTAKVEFDDLHEIFHGEVLDIKDVITFQGKSVEELKISFKESVEDYLEFCAEEDEEPEKPFSGKFNVRITPEIHKTAAIIAAKKGESLNAFVLHAIQLAINKNSRARKY